MRTPAPHQCLAVGDNGVWGQIERDDSIGAGCNCVNCMIGVGPVGQNHDRGKAARTYPLECPLLMGRRMAECFDHNQIAVGDSFTQRLVGTVQIDRHRFVCNMVHDLPHFVTVRTALVEQRNAG